MNPTPHIFLVAGEASGDMHAAHLVEEIRKLNPNIRFSGVGGPQMKKAGVELHEDLTRIAVVGFWEVLKHYQEFRRVFSLILQKLQERPVNAVVLIDYPGFNLRLAKELKKLNIKVIYYISPQVWAWKENRVQKIRRDVDRMLVLFPFEKDFYEQRGVAVDFVGHPLLDIINIKKSKETVLNELGLQPRHLTVGILPGSRLKEVVMMLPSMLGAAELLYQENPKIQFLLFRSPTLEAGIFENLLKEVNFPLCSAQNYYDGLNACDICMVTSGTATLETAILQKPMVVVYKTSFFTWALAKWLIKIPYIGLVNVVAGKQVVPECIQFAATAENIAAEIKKIYADADEIGRINTQLQRVKSLLGEPGAIRRAAEKILNLI